MLYNIQTYTYFLYNPFLKQLGYEFWDFTF